MINTIQSVAIIVAVVVVAGGLFFAFRKGSNDTEGSD